MALQLSRRAFLAVAGGGAVAAATAALVWKRGGEPTAADAPERRPDALIDHEGWIVTAADKREVPRDALAVETQ